jgi:hypothetical protein
MGQKFLAGIVGFVLSTIGNVFHVNIIVQKQVTITTPTAMVTVTQPQTATPLPTSTATPSATRAPTKKPTPTVVVTPSITPTPTIDQKALDSCNGAFMPVAEFSGHSCLASDYGMRWIDSMNGRPISQKELDETFKSSKEGEVKPMILKMCLKTNKEQFEKCSTSIRDNAERIRNELLQKIQSDVENCKKSSNFANGTMNNYTPRYMAKDRMKGMISALYDFCYSHNNSAAEYHP